MIQNLYTIKAKSTDPESGALRLYEAVGAFAPRLHVRGID